MQRSGHWEVQVQSGTGHRRIQYGPAPGDVGAFYAYRGTEEVLGGWRERVFSDVTYGEEQVAHHVGATGRSRSRPRTATTARPAPTIRTSRASCWPGCCDSFDIVFTQDRSGFAVAGAGTGGPVGRIEINRDVSEGELRALMRRPAPG